MRAVIESAEAQAFSLSNDNACYMFNCTEKKSNFHSDFRIQIQAFF